MANKKHADVLWKESKQSSLQSTIDHLYDIVEILRDYIIKTEKRRSAYVD